MLEHFDIRIEVWDEGEERYVLRRIEQAGVGDTYEARRASAIGLARAWFHVVNTHTGAAWVE